MSAPWVRDNRLLDGPGQLEWRPISDSPQQSLATDAISANPNRVRLIVNATFTAPALGDVLVVAVGFLNDRFVLASATPEHPTVILRYEDVGDAVTRSIALNGSATVSAIDVSEVVWHPMRS